MLKSLFSVTCKNSSTFFSPFKTLYKPLTLAHRRYFTMATTANATANIRLPDCLEKIRPKTSPEFDYSTNSNYLNFFVKKTALDFEINFKEKLLTGFVQYSLLPLNNSTKSVVLDLTSINIAEVLINDKQVSNYKIHKQDDEKYKLGHALEVPNFNDAAFVADEEFQLRIYFSTTSSSTALQFLSKSQTDGQQHEYLFSQSEPIHARSIYPCFDTPSIKSQFQVRVKSPYKTLVSALTDKKAQAEETDPSVYHFTQPVPIPSYLFAIVSGDITSARIGPRSLIYTEPVNIDRCANEFKDEVVEKFLQILEKLIYKYEWTDYDFVVAPMAFPYGGMENPQLTLANSTIISGDAENIDVVAHELAHSYSGNLVTNGSWEHFWLNEGWTVYLERRILAALHDESYRHFSAIIGWNDLEESISRMDQKYTRLIQNLKDGSDPDDAFSTVPYEKGFNFLFHLENTVGGTEKFDPFIKHYFSKFNKKSLDTYQFIETLFEYYAAQDQEIFAKLQKVDYETWLLGTGLPPKPQFDTTLVNQCLALSEKWYTVITQANANNTKLTKNSLSQKFSNDADVASYTSNQLVVFLDSLSNYNDENQQFLSTENGQVALQFIDEEYSRIAKNGNAEVKFRFFKVLLKGRVTKEYQVFADWLGTVGRMKFVRPGYILLNECDKQLAVETFKKFESLYHPICVAMVKKDIGLN